MKNVLFLLFVLNYTTLLSQASFTDPNNIQILTPEVSSFRKYTDAPVSYYTGVPEINIPIYNIQLKDFSLPISLSYHSGGIRVNEMAGWVGLGWSLNTVSPISRNVQGVFDEEHYMNRVTSDQKTTVQYYLDLAAIAEVGNAASIEAQNLLKDQLNSLKSGYSNAIDFMPDEFFISIPGYSGKCMYSQDLDEFVLFPMGDIKVDYNRNGYWVVIDNDGTRYEFGSDGTESNYGAPATQPAHKGAVAWQIKRIKTITGEEIIFNYESITYDREDLKVLSRKVFPSYSDFDGFYPDPILRNKKSSAVLSSIDFPSGRIDFISSLNRQDFTAMKKLDSIKVFDSNQKRIKTVSLNFAYFNTSNVGLNTVNENPQKRLKLNQVKFWNKTNVKSHNYDFTYFENLILPHRISSYAQDYWGYFNGKSSNASLFPKTSYSLTDVSNNLQIADRSISKDHFNAFLLKDITFPEGGKTEYIYERNTAQTIKLTQDIKELFPLTPDYNLDLYIGLDQKSIEVGSESLNISGYFDQNLPNGVYWGFPSPTEIVLPYTFIFKKEVTLSNLSSGNRNIWVDFTSNFTKEYISTSGLFVNYNIYYRDNLGNNQYLIQSATTIGIYTISIPINGIDINGNAHLTMEVVKRCANGTGTVGIPYLPFSTQLKVRWLDVTSESLYDDIYAGGARIKEIITYKNSDDTEPISKKEFEYTLKDGKTSGLIYSIPVHKIRMIMKTPSQLYDINCPLQTELGFQVLAQSYIPSINTKGSTVGYRRVIEKMYGKENTYLGSIERNFDYPFGVDENYYYSQDQFEGLHSALLQNKEWIKGNLLSTHYYDSYNNLKRLEENTYNLDYYSNSYLEQHKVSGINTNIIGSTCRIGYDFSCMEVYPKNYDYIQWYEGLNNPESNNSCRFYGIQVNNLRKKPYYTRKTGIALLESTKVTEIFPNNEITSTTQFYYEGNGHLQPTKIAVTNSSGERIETISKYPPDLNDIELWSHNRIVPPIQTEKYKSSTLSSTLLGKQVVNYNYFEGIYLPESVNISKGENSLSQKINYLKYDPKGKLLMYKKPDGILVSNLWGYNNQFLIAKVENASYPQVIATGVNLMLINDLTTSNAIILTELKKIRDGLPQAMVTTYTYDPLIGVTSITDPRGETIYYEYDSFNRLELIKDQNSKIIKSFCYNYQGQVENCVTVISTPDTTAPSVPTGLSSGIPATTKFTLSWNASTDNVGIAGYKIYKNGGLYATEVGTAISLFILGQTAGSTNTWTISAYDAAGNSSAQSVGKVVTQASSLPLPPENIVLTNGTQTALYFSWTAVSNADYYKIYRDGVWKSNVMSGTAGSTAGLIADTDYAIGVSGVNASGEGPRYTKILTTDPASPPTCLVAGTLITLPNGSQKLIEELGVGDNLKGINIKTLPIDETLYSTWSDSNPRVTNTVVKIVGILPTVVQETISINNGLLRTTPDHLHLIKRAGTFILVEASTIVVGDILLDSARNEVSVVSVELVVEEITVYKVDVEKKDLFIANGMITHNRKLPLEL